MSPSYLLVLFYIRNRVNSKIYSFFFKFSKSTIVVSIKGMSIPYNRIHIPKMSFMARLRSRYFFSSGASQGYLQTHVNAGIFIRVRKDEVLRET